MNEVEAREKAIPLLRQGGCLPKEKVDYFYEVLRAISVGACANPEGVANEACSAYFASEQKPVTAITHGSDGSGGTYKEAEADLHRPSKTVSVNSKKRSTLQ